MLLVLVCTGVLVVIAATIASSGTDSGLFVAALVTCSWKSPSVCSEVPAVDVPAPLLIVVEGPAKKQVRV